MRIAIMGAGSIAFGMAAFLAQAGHDPVLWSPSGTSTAALAERRPLTASGAVEGSFPVTVALTAAEAVIGADAVVLALPANGHSAVIAAAWRVRTASASPLAASCSSAKARIVSRRR